nr:hypothetical protein [uncultured Paludibaculum sp.]
MDIAAAVIGEGLPRQFQGESDLAAVVAFVPNEVLEHQPVVVVVFPHGAASQADQ